MSFGDTSSGSNHLRPHRTLLDPGSDRALIERGHVREITGESVRALGVSHTPDLDLSKGLRSLRCRSREHRTWFDRA
jgi:hypothetical protein